MDNDKVHYILKDIDADDIPELFKINNVNETSDLSTMYYVEGKKVESLPNEPYDDTIQNNLYYDRITHFFKYETISVTDSEL